MLILGGIITEISRETKGEVTYKISTCSGIKYLLHTSIFLQYEVFVSFFF